MTEPIYREFKQAKHIAMPADEKSTSLRQEHRQYVEQHPKPWYLK